jgi:hypothetical protein
VRESPFFQANQIMRVVALIEWALARLGAVDAQTIAHLTHEKFFALQNRRYFRQTLARFSIHHLLHCNQIRWGSIVLQEGFRQPNGHSYGSVWSRAGLSIIKKWSLMLAMSYGEFV